ncbi:MAG: acetyl-CoA carboxylase biotin carboxyl carrier protein [Terriglobales bacterium]
MNQKELKELIEFLIEKDIAEFELERGDVKIKIKRASEAPPAAPEVRYITMAAPAPASPVAPDSTPASSPSKEINIVAAATPEKKEEHLHIVHSPIVGTFYESPSPGSPPFVKVGDMLEVGQVLCIVEAMKLLNEIECDAAGELVKKLVTNGQPIEYGQELFALRLAK